MNEIQTVIDAVGLGALYALMAVGIALVFGVMRLINFAYGQLIMFGAYALAFTNDLPEGVSILICLGVVVALSLTMERVAFRPLRSAAPATMLVATFAISFLLQSIALLRYSFTNKPIGDPALVLSSLNKAFEIGGVHVRWITLVAIATGLVSLGAVALLLNKTSIGLQIRAAAADFQTARLLGVNADRVIAFAFLISGVLAAIVAVLFVVQTPFVTPDYALRETIIVLVAVVVGGIDRLGTATLGGFAIGLATGLFGGFLGPQGPEEGSFPFTTRVYLDSVIFLLVILVLLLRPAGLFARGRGPVERV